MLNNLELYIEGIRDVNFTNRETGEIIKGTNVYFTEKEPKNTETEKGRIQARKFLKRGDDEHVLKNGVGLYKPIISTNLRGNRATIDIVGFEFIKKVDFTPKEL